MPTRPDRRLALRALVTLALPLIAHPSRAQVVRGEPGPDLTAYEWLRTEIAAGHDAVRDRRGASGRPVIVMTGFWPPSNEIIRQFSDNPTQNPGGWVGSDWEGRGYDVYSFFPEFPAGPAPGCNWGQGMGDFEVDYQDASSDFWSLIPPLQPIGLITFSRGIPPVGWEVELNQHNHLAWVSDYTAPLKPTPAPPDGAYPANGLRCSTLPLQAITDRVNALALGWPAFIDSAGDTGDYLSEFMAYHGVWYRGLHAGPFDPTRVLAAGHIHVTPTACQPALGPYIQATEETLRTLIDLLDAGQEVPPNRVMGRGTGPAEITVDWAGTSPSYDIYRADGGCFGRFVRIGTSPAPTFVDASVTPGQTYGYMIRSIGPFCDTDSECVTVSHALCVAATLNRITGLTVVKGAASGVDLAWQPDIAAPPEYHVNTVATRSALAAPNRGVPGVGPECTVPTTACNDPDALTLPGNLFYQVLSACADAIGEEGPN